MLDRPTHSVHAAALADILLPALLIAGVVFAGNLNALFAGFVWDDRALITGNALIKHFNSLPVLFRQPFLGLYYRPVVMLSFALEYALWGLRPWGFHLTNLLIHAANSILVFLILRKVAGKKEVALVAALLFAVHPAHKGVVAIADRTGILSASFFLLSVIFYIHYRFSSNRRASLVLYGGALISCGLAFFSKEETLALPLVLILLDWLIIGEDPKRLFSYGIVRYLPFFLVAAAYLFVRSRVLGGGLDLAAAFTIAPFRRLITIPAVLADYVLLLLFPYRLDYEPRTPLALWVGEPRIAIPLLLTVVLIAAFPWLARKRRGLLFGIMWYLIVFIPMSNIIPIYPEAAHSHLFTPIHFLYLPSIGIFLCAGYGLAGILQGFGRSPHPQLQKRAAILAVCALLFFFSLLSLKRNFIWRDELRLFQYIVEMHPENPRMRLNIGTVYLERGQVDAALKHLEQAVLIAPDVAGYRNSLALAYREKGWFERAQREFHEALKLDPDSGMAYANLAATYRMQGKPAEAIDAGRKAVELAPSNALAHVNLGLAYKDAGRLADAEEQFEAAIDADPGCAEAFNGLGIVYAEKNDYALARKHWERALQIQPDLVQARENLEKLRRMGR